MNWPDWLSWPFVTEWGDDETDKYTKICSVGGIVPYGEQELHLLHDGKSNEYFIRYQHKTWSSGFRSVRELLMFFTILFPKSAFTKSTNNYIIQKIRNFISLETENKEYL